LDPEPEFVHPDAAGEAERLHGQLARLLAAGERVALCTILRLVGSGPRSAGAKMLVRASGELLGTIGGGLLEARAAAWGREALATGVATCRAVRMSNADAAREGMVCGGETELLVEPLDGGQAGVGRFFDEVQRLLAAGAAGRLAVSLRPAEKGVVTARALFSGSRLLAVLPEGSPPVPDEVRRTVCRTPVLIQRGSARYFLEPLSPPATVVICGAGHVALQLVPLCRLVGFRTVVVDDRADFASPERFPLADRVQVAPSLDRALDGVDLGPDSYVVVVTRGHAGDLAVVRQALRGRPGYLGMIGSRRKRQVAFEALAAEGWEPEELARVTSPIGLPIGAETPEEIAVSIVAQLIAVRASRREERED